ncbi:hypothetical protein [Deinococcus maricopensis]|uniref:hypothetical protein n=1 Tax=Deinococcus maricopensis TaxID=309887 RepID=UPI0002D437B7|nr:hypothetical protein [Deinococcus maricopensis]
MGRASQNLGVIHLSDKTTGDFTADEDLRVPLAQLAAVSIENAAGTEALAELEQELRTLADPIPQLAWMADANGWTHGYNQR